MTVVSFINTGKTIPEVLETEEWGDILEILSTLGKNCSVLKGMIHSVFRTNHPELYSKIQEKVTIWN